MKEIREVCGTCKYNKHFEDEKEEGFVCDNPDSEYFMEWSLYDDSCDEWEEE